MSTITITDAMTRFFSVLLWTAVFCLLLLAIDQLLVQVPARFPAHAAVATFYRDLRSRTIDLFSGVKSAPATPAKPKPAAPPKGTAKTGPASVEGIIEQRQARPTVPPAPKRAAAPDRATRYVYADSQGELHFAETLAEIPEQYRDKARRLGE
jgi:hypothetical protein